MADIKYFWTDGELKLEMTHIELSQNGNLLLTVPKSDATHTMKIRDAYTGAELFALEGHEDMVRTACFSPCGKYVASGSWDSTVRL